MKAIYVFIKKGKKAYSDPEMEIVVVADSHNEAINNALSMVNNIKIEDIELRKVTHYDLHINRSQTDVTERKVLIEERSAEIKVEHSGEITEKKVQL